MADQTVRAMDYSNLIAFKRQEFKRGHLLNDDDDQTGSIYKKRTAS
jgi:hypothetical protein